METDKNAVHVSQKSLFSIVVFGLCTGATIISYQTYLFTWDDSDYLRRSISVSRAFWSGNKHALTFLIPSIHPPIMTLLGIPWGPLTSWEAAGKCFITLTVLTAFFIACSLFLLLRAGLNPLYLAIASLCLFAAIGPYPSGSYSRLFATGFLADSLFAWIVFATVLLIPYEMRTQDSSTGNGAAHGILWAVILSAGVMTKVNFFYFLGLVVPVLFAIRVRRGGLRSGCVALSALAVASIPAVIYWLRYGLLALKNAWWASFGHDATFYKVPLRLFVSRTLRESPGMLLPAIFVIGAIAYLAVKRNEVRWGANLLPLLIMAGYCVVALASSNREIRFLFPVIIAPPFLVGLLLSRHTHALSSRSAALAAALVFVCLAAASVPMMRRPDKESIRKSEEVLAQAVDSHAKYVLLGTDSKSLNGNLMEVAIALSSQPSITEGTLAWRAASGSPIEDDFQSIRESDLVVFENKDSLLNDPITNQRAAQYEQFTRHYAGDVPVKVVDGVRMYRIDHATAGAR